MTSEEECDQSETGYLRWNLLVWLTLHPQRMLAVEVARLPDLDSAKISHKAII